MPLYNYFCKKCEKEFESYNRIDERHNERCANCGGPVEILVGSPLLKTETSAQAIQAEEDTREWTGSPEQLRELAEQERRERNGQAGAKPEKFWHTNLGETPVWIRNRHHLRRECEKRGVSCPQLGVYGIH